MKSTRPFRASFAVLFLAFFAVGLGLSSPGLAQEGGDPPENGAVAGDNGAPEGEGGADVAEAEVGLDQQINEAFKPISDFFGGVIFFEIYEGVPFVLLLLVLILLFLLLLFP